MEQTLATQNYLSEIVTKLPAVGLFIGKKKTGKSVDAITLLDDYVAGNVRPDIAPRRCIVIDTNDEFGDFWHHDNPNRSIEAIQVDEISDFLANGDVGIRRVRPFNPDKTGIRIEDMGGWVDSILSEVEHKNGCVVLIEDSLAFISRSLIIRHTSVNRTCNVDLIFTFQSMRSAFRIFNVHSVDYIRLYHCNDRVNGAVALLEDRTEIFNIAENIVIDHVTWDYYSLFIDNENLKIKGDLINEAYIDAAITNYISSHGNKILKPILNNPTIMATKPENEMVDKVFAFLKLHDALTKKYF